MGHKADSSFFDSKREWSKRKDEILGYYLVPYLPKIATQRRPVLIVDGFAGPGFFADGEPGSPVIIASTVANARSLRVSVQCLFIEWDSGLFAQLEQRVKGFENVQAVNADFDSQIPWIEQRADTCNVFLYLDPFTVEGIRWHSLNRIFAALSHGSSIEMLLNFNVHSFCRRGLAALRLADPESDDDVPASDWESSSTPVQEGLSAVVGGDWWQDILRSDVPYPEKVARVTSMFCAQLRNRFQEVCTYEVREHWRHKVPKYVLVFASRHRDALELMNDAMCRARQKVVEADPEAAGSLFELRPKTLVPDSDKLPTIVVECADTRMTRGDLLTSVIRREFCLYSSSEIRRAISDQIKRGALRSATGRSRINDKVEVWRE